MKLLRLCAHEIRLNQPLPWGVRNEPGQLLLNKGFVLGEQHQIDALLERGVYVDADEYEQERLRQAQAAAAFDPFSMWAQIQKRVSKLLRSYSECADFPGEVGELSGDIVQTIAKDVDAGKFEMVSGEPTNYAVNHSLRTAFVATVVAERLGWSADERASLISASLTMNIAMLDLQNVLASQTTPLTPAQREAIASHSRRGRETLESVEVTAQDWLRAVDRHHVTHGGQALAPDHRSTHGELACLIHYVDVYLAKLSPRATRPALAPNVAAREMFVAAGGAGNPVAAAIVKEMGIYPPGCFVKLANGETAVVIRSGATANSPQVCGLVSADGWVYPDPVPRDTENPKFKIVATILQTNVLLRLNRQQLFGYGH